MAKLQLKSGTTSKTVNVFFQDSSKTTGAGLAGVSNNSSGLLAHFLREGDSASTAMAVTSAAIGTWTSSGLVEVESSAMPGLYQFGLPNSICSAGANAKSAVVYFTGVTNLAPCLLEIEITQVDNQDAVHFGLTSLPNTAVTTNGSLLTSGTGTAQISVSAGQVLIQGGQVVGSVTGAVGSVTASVTVGSVAAAASNIKKNTIVSAFPFVMTDNTTHNPRTGLTVSANRSLDGAAFAACTFNVTETANGWYTVNLAAADTNGNTIAYRFTAVSADDRNVTVLTQP